MVFHRRRAGDHADQETPRRFEKNFDFWSESGGRIQGMNIAEERCFNHPSREAGARCPKCKRFFCRECISEHDGQVICAYCIKSLRASPSKRLRLVWLIRAVQVLAGLLLLWSSFYLIGKELQTIPSSFHQDTFLQEESRGK